MNFGLYVSAFQITSNTILYQQKRFRGKINIQKPRKPHFLRARVVEFLTPFYLNPNFGKKPEELCPKTTKNQIKKPVEYNPYEKIIARDIRNWFDTSKMIAICHQNSFSSEQEFVFKVKLKRANMYLKRYGIRLMKLALEDSPYVATMPLYKSSFSIIFSLDTDTAALEKILKKHQHTILLSK